MNSTLAVPVRMMARYNAWANAIFVDFFKQQPIEQIEAFVASSFPSIRRTLMHIWDAQHIWYLRLHEEQSTEFLSAIWQGTFDELCDGLNRSSQDFVELVRGYDLDTLSDVLNYSTKTYGPQASGRYEILLHVFNHSMYHRGQCVTMAHTLGMSGIPGTDLIKYLREQGSP